MLANQSSYAADLALPDLPRRPERTLTGRLAGSLQDAIRSRRLRPGAPVPSSRALANQLGCSRWVVVQVYEQLVAEGFLTATPGGATRVYDLPGQSRPQAIEPPASTLRYRIDLTPGQPDLSAFPASAWLRSTQHVLASMEWDSLNYVDPSGHPHFKSTMSEVLGRGRGVVAQAQQIHATAGASHAIGLICRAAARHGHTHIAVEEPGWPPLRAFSEAAGLKLVPIPVDQHGLRVDLLEQSPHVRLALVTPAHQFPTGVVMSPERRNALLQWSVAVDGLIIEDSYDSEFRYDKRPLGCLQSMAPDRVAFVGSTTKLLAPSLRLGWLVAPPQWSPLVAAAREGHDLGVSALIQLTFADLAGNGQLERHLNRSRRLYRAKRACMLDALSTHLPHLQVVGIAAGLHLLARLPAGSDERRITAVAARHGVKVFGLERYDMGVSRQRGLVLGYARATMPAIQEGIRILSTCM
ncbi:MocR-like pyridoxine biosynthesis transcription factor PdxR [Sinosporangium siamense]|uniref:GntR family transcriptional regulator n=1 Tax=Sinosporangium siamense TaxID=1367973 RepID=A0A919V876_9ACTN|nr:PLP-dependent aminotransferase family protein [Sinosporangium siamense]GII92912.1 GntR family transcriptional regulator [Sinosporangium siamense]